MSSTEGNETRQSESPTIAQLTSELADQMLERKALRQFMSTTEKKVNAFQEELGKHRTYRRNLDQKIRRLEQQIEAEKFKLTVNDQPGDVYLIQRMSAREGGIPILKSQECFATFTLAKRAYDSIMYEQPRKLNERLCKIFPCGINCTLLCVKADYDQQGDSYTAIVQLRPEQVE